MKTRRDYIEEKLFGFDKEVINSMLQIEDDMRCDNCTHYMRNDEVSGICNTRKSLCMCNDICKIWSPKTFIATKRLF